MEWENNCLIMNKEDDHMDLPPGFRFHPTDEELISHYLSRKVANKSLSSRAVGEVDLNKCEPWDLPWRANMGETEWYFFCVRDRKYPSGLRTNRATDAGYWKATGKDREIYKGKLLVGMKKTLVFYKGRAPKGQKTNWVMHEYRLEGNLSADNLPNAAKNDLVLCRVFHKNHGCKKTHISRMIRTPIASQTDPTRTSPLPPLIDSSETVTNMGEISHMTCFSNQMEDQINNTSLFSMTNSVSLPQFPLDCGFLTENRKQEVSSDTTGMSTDMSSVMSCNELAATGPSVSDGPIDIDCLWNY